MGARFLAGEKCCWCVLNAGFLRKTSEPNAWYGLKLSLEPRVDGLDVTEVTHVDVDRARPWDDCRDVDALVEAVRTWRDVVIGGFDRSFLARSLSAGRRFRCDTDLGRPVPIGFGAAGTLTRVGRERA